MKKLLLLSLIFPCIAVSASEITEDYLDIATNYCIYGKYSDASVYLDRILQLEPNNAEVKDLKIQSQELPAAAQNLTFQLQTKIYNRQCYIKTGEYSKEISTLSASSESFWSCYFLAEYYRKNNDLKNAMTYYQKAASLKPNYSQTYLGIAQVQAANKDYAGAIQTLNKYQTYNKESDLAYALKAEANLNMNNISEAETNIKKALEIEENITYLLLEAKILYHKGSYNDARDKFNLLSRNVQTSEVYKYLGLCDYALNNYASALLNLDKAIILSDDDKTLNSTYNEIKTKLDNQ
ncbi:MAG: tetratricopeptide repeat protein [Candidatus Gastranaerophilaceae bacterium]